MVWSSCKEPVEDWDRDFSIKLDMCLWNMDAPGGNKVKIWKNL